MADWPRIQQRFGGSEKLLYQMQSLVLPCNFCSWQGSIGAQHVFAVKTSFSLDSGRIEVDGALLDFQEPTIAPVADDTLGPLCEPLCQGLEDGMS